MPANSRWDLIQGLKVNLPQQALPDGLADPLPILVERQ